MTTFELTNASANSSNQWSEISAPGIDSWNQRLLDTDASYRQYPYWNDPYRKQHFVPRYLVYGSENHTAGYACVVTIGIPGFRIGLVQSGPVILAENTKMDAGFVQGLVEWAKQCGYVFLRFTNSDHELLDFIASGASSDQVDAFPFYGEPRQRLLVKQLQDDDKLLASFQSICRYEIRAANRAGYEIRVTDSPEEFAKVWPMFKAMARRKGFRLSSRPLSGWIDLVRRARPQQLARLYSAYLNGQCIQSILVIRYGKTAEYMIGALNVETLRGHVSPGCLIHWHAMRDFYRLGCEYYNLGAPGTILYQFKRKFRPTLVVNPLPVTVVIRPNLYRLWSLARRTVSPWHSRIRRLVYKQARQSTGISALNNKMKIPSMVLRQLV